ncbi:sugar transferase [Nocardioides sp. SOB77]|uniref:Sugar transferase n=1 Tax=Nocardioides oceani TaxID=3058369 RepID=A0ABT8FJS1_9ACTN|nr:sugar transferase [Nocardioides oceani]MDN4174402.1 sugar transferase [Nocardioides oceani]
MRMSDRWVGRLPSLPSQRPLLVLLDLLAVVLAAVPVLGTVHVSPVPVAAAGAAVFLTCHSADLYRPRLVLSVLEDLPRLLLAAALGTLALVAAAPRIGVTGDPTWPVAPAFAAGLALLLVVVRTAAYTTVHGLRRRGLAGHPVIIVGGEPVGSALAATLLDQPQLGLRPVGIVERGASARRLPVPLLGGIDRLEQAMTDLGVHDVVFAFPAPPDAQTVAVVRRCVERDHQVFVVPRFHELMGATGTRGTEVVQGVTLMRLRRWGHRPLARWGKRALDVALASVGLVLAAPVMAACALATRIETGPGVVFRQTRVGTGGRPFTLYKLRSLRPDDEIESATRWSIDGDARIGPVGRFLRRTGLDELPQLVNVLKGDMSLVGPRPERPHFVDAFSRSESRYADRHRVPAGLTGLAQVHRLRGDTSIAERTRVDNYYIENWSLWSDVKIMCRTLPVLVRAPRGEVGAVRLGSSAPGGPTGRPR